MKKNTVYVAKEKFVGIAKKLGLLITEQKGNLRIEAAEHSDRRVYVANGKGVSDVTISGFVHPAGVEIPEDKRPTSRVHQRLDFGTDEATILRSFFRVLKDGVVERRGPSVEAARRGGRSVPAPSEEEIDAAVAAACEDMTDDELDAATAPERQAEEPVAQS